MACSLWFKTTTTTIDELAVVSQPRYGTLTPRGRTGIIYRAQAGMKGDDAFAVRVSGRSPRYEGVGTVLVRVRVD